jgi:hypothetical protein
MHHHLQPDKQLPNVRVPVLIATSAALDFRREADAPPLAGSLHQSRFTASLSK